MNKRILLLTGILMFAVWGRGRAEAATWARIGPPGSVLSIAIDPFDPSRVLAATRGALYESEDAGAHWALRTISPPATLVAFDPVIPGVAYAGTSTYPSISNGVQISVDGGLTWRPSALSGPDWVVSLSVSTFPSDRIYAATEYIGGFATLRFTDSWSDDGGGSWNVFASQDQFVDPIVPSRSGPVVYGFNPQGQVVRSDDAAATFDPVATLPTTCGVDQSPGLLLYAGIAIDPQSSDIVYATRVSQQANRALCGGASKSVDGGRTWQEMSVAGFVKALAVDPANSEVIYAGAALPPPNGRSAAPTLFRSTDGGLTWAPFDDGLGGRDVLTFAIDANGHHVYAGTVDGLYVFETPVRTRILAAPRSDRVPVVRGRQP